MSEEVSEEEICQVLNGHRWRGRDDWRINGTFLTYPLLNESPEVEMLEALTIESARAIALHLKEAPLIELADTLAGAIADESRVDWGAITRLAQAYQKARGKE